MKQLPVLFCLLLISFASFFQCSGYQMVIQDYQYKVNNTEVLNSDLYKDFTYDDRLTRRIQEKQIHFNPAIRSICRKSNIALRIKWLHNFEYVIQMRHPNNECLENLDDYVGLSAEIFFSIYTMPDENVYGDYDGSTPIYRTYGEGYALQGNASDGYTLSFCATIQEYQGHRITAADQIQICPVFQFTP